MKTLPAILFALGITAVLAITMAVVGANALVNPATVPTNNAPAAVASGVSAASYSGSDPATVAQLQALVTQYQDREKQYQSELSDAASKLTQANTQMQQLNDQLTQYQQLITTLEQAGVIRITSDGRVFIGRGNN